jgi:hypothetical protein
MANLTVTVDERVLRRARIKAIERGTSVNALVSDYLERFAGSDETAAALRRFLDLAEGAGATSGSRGRSWRRDDLYDRAVPSDR